MDKGVAVLSSADAGASWTAEAPLDLEGLSKGAIQLSKPAVGHGIQIQPQLCPGGCKNAGRLIVPMVCTNKTASGSHGDRGCVTCNACLLLSDDSGKTWSLGAVGQQGTRESQVVQLPSNGATAALYATERNMGAHPGHRQYAFSMDGGDTFAITGTDATLTGPVTAHWTGIVGSVNGILGNLAGGASTLVYSGPASTSMRQDMSIHTSANGGRSWSAGKTLWAGFAGYVSHFRLPCPPALSPCPQSLPSVPALSPCPQFWPNAGLDAHDEALPAACYLAPLSATPLTLVYTAGFAV